MGAIKNLRLAALALLSALVVPGAFVAACSSNSASNPTPTITTYDANTSTPDSTTVTPEDGGSDVAVGPGEDASSDAREEPIVLEDAQACTASHAPAQGAPADGGCWSCAPQSNTEFLNQCAGTGVLCTAFDN